MKGWQLVGAVLLTLVSICFGVSTDVNDLHPGAGWGLSARSENGQFAVVLIRSPDMNDCVLEVYDVNASQNKLLWKADVASNFPRGGLFLSDDAGCVARLNTREESRGDALQFYTREQGKIKGYSHDQLLGFCETLTGKGKYNLFPTFYMFHTFEGLTYFCGCLFGKAGLQWVAWSAADGQHLNLDQTVANSITDDARRHFRKELGHEGESPNKILGCLFLSHFKRPEDRPYVEKLLTDQHFVTNPIWVERSSFLQTLLEQINIETQTRYQLDYFCASSGFRETADRELEKWDGKVTRDRLRSRKDPYHCLGTALVQVVLKSTPKRVGGLWVYLVPASIGRAEWDHKRRLHYLMAEFEGLGSEYEIGRTIPCIFGGVTPGKYWIKAVWDKEKPFEPLDRSGDGFCRPQKGDYESADSPVIEVEAAQTIDAGVIQCKQKVKGK
ncbi:MAG TPA: hypothetical protein VMX13_06500 [Sedimentisphaerales bacterium]|nr:hypothetical protein [Sedimentisphaerales bacterium]